MNSTEVHTTTEAMLRYGGRFFRSLATAIRYADNENRERIFLAFPKILSEYGPQSKFYNPTEEQK